MKEVIEVKGLQIKEGQLVVTTKETPKTTPKQTRATKNLYGVQLSTKPNLELRTALKVIQNNSEKKNITFKFLFAEFSKEIIKGGNKINKNTEGRLRRILYRSVESGITKESIQGIKFNLAANYKGVKVIVSQPFEFGVKGDVSRSQVENNLYSFKINKVVKTIEEGTIQSVADKVKAFKKAIQ